MSSNPLLLPALLMAIVLVPQLAMGIFYIRAVNARPTGSPKAQREYLQGRQRFYMVLSLSLLALSTVAVFLVPLFL